MKVGRRHYRTVWFEKGSVCLVDQNALPFRFRILRCRTYKESARAMRRMSVRGAGAIGVTAGFAMAQAALAQAYQKNTISYLRALKKARALIESTRSTARNLFYAVERVYDAARSKSQNPREGGDAALREAESIALEDAQAAQGIGRIGKSLIPQGASLITHCNAGWLAFSDWGTALAPLYMARRSGKRFFVYVPETRPRSQGARLTAWELGHARIPHAVIADSAAGSIMREKRVKLVIVGADRIAANGDTANKIGTYSLALLARAHGIPFYVAAPSSTFDLRIKSGSEIPIEHRSPREFFDPRWFRVLKKSRVENPAFDVTPARYITGIITEKGLIKPHFREIKKILSADTRPNTHDSGLKTQDTRL